MRRRCALVCVTLSLLLSVSMSALSQSATGGSATAQSQKPLPPAPKPSATTQAKPDSGMTNEAVVKMVKAGLAEEVILTMINSQPTQFAVTPDDIIALKKAGVSDKIIAAMVSPRRPTASTATVQPASSVAAPPPAPNADRPNDAQILSAIRSDPNRNNPRSLTALALSTTPVGSGARINNVDVTITGFRPIKWGEFNGAGKYWPVELCVSGIGDNRVLAALQTPRERAANGIPQAQKFRTRARYRLYKDDFGDVKAEQMLVSEWTPEDSICPAPPAESAAVDLINQATRLDVEADAFPVRTDIIDGTFDAVWARVIEVLTQNKEKIGQVDKTRGVVITDQTRHGGFSASFDKYCVVVEAVTPTSSRVTVKTLSYKNTSVKLGKPTWVPRNAELVEKLSAQFFSQLKR